MNFSIVVPSLNQRQFLGTAVRSILEQPGDFDLECIVVDGGSKDGSAELLAKIAERPRMPGRSFYWASEPDHGQADAINKGLRRATGDVLAYLNSDDCYASGALERVASAFSATAAYWLTGRCRIIDAEGNEIHPAVSAYRNVWLQHYSYTALRMVNFIAQPATFWRRSAGERAGPLDSSLSYTMDYDYWLRLGRLSDPVVIRDQLAAFRLHTESKSGTAYARQFEEDYETFLRTHPGAALRAFHRLHNGAVVTAYRVLK